MENVGAAMGLVILAGGSTSIGAAVVYIPSLVSLANSRTLAVSLGLSSGVMLFVSFAEIFRKSQTSFERAGFEPNQAYALAMVAFFGGAILMILSHYALEHILGGHGHGDVPNADQKSIMASEDSRKEDNGTTNDSEPEDVEAAGIAAAEEFASEMPDMPDPWNSQTDWGMMMLPCCEHEHDKAHKKLETLHEMAEKIKELEELEEERAICLQAGVPQSAVDGHEKFQRLQEERQKQKEKDRLVQISYKTALAIALHNFPEGLATFVATLADPTTGVILAIGIAIHNIPEGLAVALPLYYATGNRTKAFLCGTLSGFTEILAALLGWAVLANAFSPILYAIIFGIVSGMMVLISIRELLPTAHRYDPEDKYVTLAFTGGMFIMALSLALIALF